MKRVWDVYQTKGMVRTAQGWLTRPRQGWVTPYPEAIHSESTLCVYKYFSIALGLQVFSYYHKIRRIVFQNIKGSESCGFKLDY